MRSLFDPLPTPVTRARPLVSLPPIVVSTQGRAAMGGVRSPDDDGAGTASHASVARRLDASSFSPQSDTSAIASASDAATIAERRDASSIASPSPSTSTSAAPSLFSSTAPAPAVPAIADARAAQPTVADRTNAAVRHTEAALREAGLGGRFWRGDSLSTTSLSSVPSGFRTLDEQLPEGGWPSGCMTELLLARAGLGEIRFLAATLAALTQAGREIVLLGPPHIPDPTGWEQLGIDMRRVLIVRTPRPVDRLWALEQSLKSSAFGALLAWLPEERTLARPDALRRLQLAAASANGLTFVFRPATAEFQPSPAPLRLALATGKPDGARRTLTIRLLKRRGPVLAKPLTLRLPEILQGMRAFPLTERERIAADRPRGALADATSSVRPSNIAHALAGPLLSDADA